MVSQSKMVFIFVVVCTVEMCGISCWYVQSEGML